MHIIVIVGDIEDHEALVFQEAVEQPFDLVLVRLLHTENYIRPFDQVAADCRGGGFVGSGADGVDALNFAEDGFGGRAAEFIGGADEEEVH